MPAEALVIDADGHILEPPDLWEKYLDPKYRARAMRIRVAEDGYEFLEIDGKRARLTQPGVLGSLGGMGKNVNEAKQLRESMMTGKIRPEDARAMRPTPEQTYMKGAAFGTMDAKERIELIDKEGMAKALLYPTIGLLWEAELFDPELSAGLLHRLQSMDRGFLPRHWRTPRTHRASLARRSRGRREGVRARRERWMQRRIRCAVYHHAQTAWAS